MTEPDPPPPDEPQPQVANLELKALALLLLTLALVAGSVLYVLYARGAFEQTQRLILVAEDSEGVGVGMDLTFSGFAIGRVRRIELADDGNARILIDVPLKDARWLRTSSIFTLVRGLVGNTNIRAHSGILSDPPLPDGAVRAVLRGDIGAEIPRVVGAVRDLTENLAALTARDAPLAQSLIQAQAMVERINGSGGALSLLLGSEDKARALTGTLLRSNELIDRSNTLLARLDGLIAKADTQVFGPAGVMPETRAAAVQLNAMLGEARASLKRVDGLLQEAQGVASNVQVATADLGSLRGEVESSLRKVDGLINEINRKWPFARDTEIKLP